MMTGRSPRASRRSARRMPSFSTPTDGLFTADGSTTRGSETRSPVETWKTLSPTSWQAARWPFPALIRSDAASSGNQRERRRPDPSGRAWRYRRRMGRPWIRLAFGVGRLARPRSPLARWLAASSGAQLFRGRLAGHVGRDDAADAASTEPGIARLRRGFALGVDRVWTCRLAFYRRRPLERRSQLVAARELMADPGRPSRRCGCLSVDRRETTIPQPLFGSCTYPRNHRRMVGRGFECRLLLGPDAHCVRGRHDPARLDGRPDARHGRRA